MVDEGSCDWVELRVMSKFHVYACLLCLNEGLLDHQTRIKIERMKIGMMRMWMRFTYRVCKTTQNKSETYV